MPRSQLTPPSVSGRRPAFDYLTGFAACSILAAMDMSGVLPALEGDGLANEEFEQRPREEADLLRAALEYLCQRGLVTGRDGTYHLSDHGRQVSADMGYLTWLVGGYGEPFHRFAEFIAEGKRYGVDCVRNVRWLADGTATLASKDVVPYVVDLLEELEFSRVLDIGCGNGRFLLRVCERFGVRGVGLDISPDALTDARAASADAGMEDQVEFTQGDARALDGIPGLGGVDLVVTFFLLHEILAAGRPALVEWFRELSARLPAQALLLAGEVQPPTGTDTRELFTPEFTLVHALMRQRLLAGEDWRTALEEGGFTVRKIISSGQPGGMLILAQNAR